MAVEIWGETTKGAHISFIALLLLCGSGCVESTSLTKTDGSDGRSKRDSGCADDSCGDRDDESSIGSDTPIEAGVIDVSSSDESSPNLDASTGASGTCRVVDPEDDADNEKDDAGIEEGPSDSQEIGGIISHQGDCLSGIHVCVKHSMSAAALYTDRYGSFTYRETFESDFESWLIIPRSAEYLFEPNELRITNDGLESTRITVNFTAIRRELPSHATGYWKVVGENKGSQGDEEESVFEFKDGCLFGGVDCVNGLHYSDEFAFCRMQDHDETDVGLIPYGDVFISTGRSPKLHTGEFDPDTQRWTFTVEQWYLPPWPQPKPIVELSRSTMVLERVR